MPILDLSELEVDLVRDLLEREVADVRAEIQSTHDPHYRDELRDEENLLLALLHKLRLDEPN